MYVFYFIEKKVFAEQIAVYYRFLQNISFHGFHLFENNLTLNVYKAAVHRSL